MTIFNSAMAQSDLSTSVGTEQNKWYDRINLRGYAQLRYNRLLETNPLLKNEQGDKSWGDGGGLFIRRVRLVFSGQISERVFFYIQPDFASSISTDNLHFGQIRDAYFDLGLDDDNEFRFRIGQSKIPFGFENMQSSSNRLPLDRADGTNSSFVNERDLGVFFYWAPKRIRERFSLLVNEGLKGSGDFGVFGLGFFNGQGANKPELNKNKHIVTRISYPLAVGNQFIEPGIQAYTGRYQLFDAQLSEGVKTASDKTYIDERIAASVVLYPKPFGIQAEYNVGRGPAFDKETDSIRSEKLQGGYVTFSYRKLINDQTFIPFARLHYYDGGKKHELDARKYEVKELEIGVEWQPVKQFELVCQYTLSSRRFEDFKLQDNLQRGNLLRIQAQINF
ncbi:porin [Olivibacter sp. XZL3]|uniref:porin n=1 Tax=Olivibacter sp. XZL3 TaxID=1735116 RepID=UPI001064F3DF|nr:porin [Olivibacter sp. XZL3]